MSIENKLNYLSETKDLIKQALINKGVEVDDSTPFREYADKVKKINYTLSNVNNTNMESYNSTSQSLSIFTNDRFINIRKYNSSNTGYLCLKHLSNNNITLGNTDIYLRFNISELANSNDKEDWIVTITGENSSLNTFFLYVDNNLKLNCGSWQNGTSDIYDIVTGDYTLPLNKDIHLKISLNGVIAEIYNSLDNGNTYNLIGTCSIPNFSEQMCQGYRISIGGDNSGNRKIFGTFYYNDTKLVDRITNETLFKLERIQGGV